MKIRQQLLRLTLGVFLVLLIAGHACEFYILGPIAQLERVLYDVRLRFTADSAVDSRIVILDIDEQSLALNELGRWPWSRDVLATLVNKLFDQHQIALLGFDVVFAEPEQQRVIAGLRKYAPKNASEAKTVNDFLDYIAPLLDHDAAFAKAMEGRPVVLGYYFNNDDRAVTSGGLPPAVFEKSAFAEDHPEFPQWRGYSGNLGGLSSAAIAAGHFNLQVDQDGVARKVPLLVGFQGRFYEALSLSMLRQWIRINGAAKSELLAVDRLPNISLSCDGANPIPDLSQPLTCLQVGAISIPVDAAAQALVPYRQAKGNYLHLSMADVWAGTLPPNALRNKIVLVGTSAPGLRDLKATPIAASYPGVEIHASLLSGMLDQSIKQHAEDLIGGELLVVIVLGLLLALTLPFISLIPSVIIGTILTLLAITLNFWAWSNLALVIPIAGTLTVIIAILLTNIAIGYFQTLRSKRQFADLFGQYVPPELVEKMSQDPSRYGMQVRETELSILFSDIRGFTGISEILGPRDLGLYINEYLSAMSHVIRIDFHGTLDKFIGDAVMAFWGAPLDDRDHAIHAIEAAMGMQQAVIELNRSFAAKGWPPLKIGVGICSGMVRVGDMGSIERRAYTAMGNAVNTASRLEARTKHYSIGILVSEQTVLQAPEIAFREVDLVQLKGQTQPVRIYEPVAKADELDAEQKIRLQQWGDFLAGFRKKDWAASAIRLTALRQSWPEDGLLAYYQVQLESIREQNLPEDWDGITVFNEK